MLKGSGLINMPLNPCFTSTSDDVVAVDAGKIYLSKFGFPNDVIWNTVSPANNGTDLSGSVLACTTFKNVVIVIVSGSGEQSRPDIHLFDLKAPTWIKAQLVSAPPGTFSDIPPIQPPPGNPGGPGTGGPNEGGGSNHSGDPSTAGPSSANATTSRAGLIGGIVGGIVVLGVLIFAGFFFRRRRGLKQKGQDESGSGVKPLDGDGNHHNEQRMHGSRRGGRGNGRNPEELNHHEFAYSRANNHHEKTWPSVHNQYEMPLSQASSPQAMAWPQVNGLQEMHLSQAGGLKEVTRTRVNGPQEMTWAPSSYDHKTASSLAYNPRKKTRSRINGPEERARAMVPVAHRVNDPQYTPNQQF
ncbi:hypothetical protein DFQ27_000113 [Actinomortierella ambigua]|uniref:Uncharacterized protein n=1 Tax=Actinomortierella ambigua TaxID=1343610 RepID=A0A9P6QGK7_9FUNG|nr:hypothetical protein DFQ27_000113 [Actinomortierella ambigua]